MNMDNGFNIFLIFVALLLKERRAAITVGPSNTVASIGEQIKLSCSADTEIAYWYFSQNGILADETPITRLGCMGVIPRFTDHYAVESIAGGTTCNLIIEDITMAQAGVYKCTEFANKALSILTVTDPKPNIIDNSTTPAVEQENVVIDCEINYNGSSASNPTLRPYFYWTNSTGQRITSFYDSTTENMAFSQLAVTAGRQNIAPYTCHVYFIMNSPIPPNYASNIPIVNSVNTSRTIEVHYYPAFTSITSTVSTTDNCVYRQETLVCTADAHPPAQYEWLDLSNNAVSSGATNSISSGGRYQCIAFNVIRSQRYNDTKIQTVITCSSPQNLTISGPGCANNSCTCANHGPPIKLTCTANGYPEPTYNWWSDVPNHQNPGNTSKIDVNYNGIYNCTASNRYGNQNHTETVSISVSVCETAPIPTKTSSPSISPTTAPERNLAVNPQTTGSLSTGAAAGIAIGCIIILANVILIGLFIGYYGKVPQSETNTNTGSANSKCNKNRLDRRFPWLHKMLPCLNDTKQEAGSNIPWILLFAFLGTITGVVTFPVWIILANKLETNETSSLTTRENGGEEGESAANGMSPTNYPPPDYPPDAPPFKNRTQVQQQKYPSLNSSTVSIEPANSRQFRNPDSSKPNTSPAWKPTPPDKQVPSGPAKKYATTDPVIADSPLYADLPLKLNQIPLKPQQYLDDPESSYAQLKRV